MKNYYETEFILATGDVGFDKEYSVSGMCSSFQAVASCHTQEMGVDSKSLLDKSNAIWVLTRIKLRVKNPPSWNERVRVKTVPLPPGSVRMERACFFYSEDGHEAGRLSSEWCMLDRDSGRPRRVSSTHYPLELNHQNLQAEADYYRGGAQITEKDYLFSHTARYSDIDMNLHMNNVAYIKLSLDALSIAEYQRWRISCYDIAFKSQAFEGERLDLYRTNEEGGTVYIVAQKESGERVFETRLELEPRKLP